MPAPLVFTPVVVRALAMGGAAALVLAAASSRRARPENDPPRSVDEAARDHGLDAAPEGGSAELSHSRGAAQARLGGRWRRIVRFGPGGPGLAVDAAALGRFRVRLLGRERRSRGGGASQ